VSRGTGEVKGERVEQIRARAAEVVDAWAPHPAGECIRDSSRWPLVEYSEVRDLAADWQRLTAEVQRLRGVAHVALTLDADTPSDEGVMPSGLAQLRDACAVYRLSILERRANLTPPAPTTEEG